MAEQNDTQKCYTGSCHCGAVAFEAEMSLAGLITCNCSICRRKGSILGFIPVEKFRLKQGQDQLSDYQFGAKRIHHLFCKNCGVTGFAIGNMPDGTEMRAVNVRCLDGVELENLQVQHFDGKSL